MCPYARMCRCGAGTPCLPCSRCACCGAAGDRRRRASRRPADRRVAVASCLAGRPRRRKRRPDDDVRPAARPVGGREARRLARGHGGGAPGQPHRLGRRAQRRCRSNTALEIRVSLSTHVAELLDHGQTVRTIPVAIGAGDSPTPTGRFAVAEKLSGAVLGSGYGCCLLGLTARQLRPPPGWSTARPWFVAIHGGGGIGAAVSAGCLHASEADLRYLLADCPAGTPVLIRR